MHSSSTSPRRVSVPGCSLRKNSSVLASFGCSAESTYSTIPRVKLRPSASSRKRSALADEDDDKDSGVMIDEKVEEMKEHGDGVLNWKVDDLAAQLTLIAHSLFQELQPCDLKSLKWYNPRMKNQPESVRVNEITRRFNYDGQWAVREILKYQTPRQRAEVMSHFVRLARRLFELNNFHSSYAVLAALESCPIARLVQTHALLPKRDRLMWEELAMRMSSDSNWKSFRDYQESAGYPRIPHIGFYKTDLIHAFHAYSNPAERDRRMGIVEQRVFDLFSRSNYGFLEEGPACLYKYLHSLRYLEELQKFVDDENIKRSKYVEPDSMESSSATEDKSGGGVSCSSKRNTGDVPTLVEVAVMEDGHDGIRATNLIDDSAIEILPNLMELGNGLNGVKYSLNTANQVCFLRSSITTAQRIIPCDQLDDVIFAPYSKNSFRLSQSYSTSTDGSSLNSLHALNRLLTFQSILERKTLVKNGRLQYFPRWKPFWVAIWGSNLITFKPKNPFRSSSRSHFQMTYCNLHVITGWKLVVNEKELGLTSPNNEFVFRFKAQTVTEIKEWVKYLRRAVSNMDHQSNLISFEAVEVEVE